jgi:hypothetical protein
MHICGSVTDRNLMNSMRLLGDNTTFIGSSSIPGICAEFMEAFDLSSSFELGSRLAGRETSSCQSKAMMWARQ